MIGMASQDISLHTAANDEFAETVDVRPEAQRSLMLDRSMRAAVRAGGFKSKSYSASFDTEAKSDLLKVTKESLPLITPYKQ